ncbi:MAG: ATP-binding cassette domain-containing protein, partial [Deltaproteobacteria bacterium]
MISLNKISISFGDKKIFNSVSLDINTSARIGIVGNNGAGKTTLLKAIIGEIDIDSGNIEISGKKNIRIGLLPQEVGTIAD